MSNFFNSLRVSQIIVLSKNIMLTLVKYDLMLQLEENISYSFTFKNIVFFSLQIVPRSEFIKAPRSFRIVEK